MPRRRFRLLLAAAILATVATLVGVALAGPADIDTTYGAGGVTDPGFVPIAIARDSAGRLLVIGQFRVLRLTASGAADPTFNGGAPLNTSTTLTSVAAAPDGTILLGGTDGNGGVVTRLTASGAVDTTFGTGGSTELTPDGNTAATVQALAVASDGSVAVAGDAPSGRTPSAFAARLTALGAVTFTTGFPLANANAVAIDGAKTDIGGDDSNGQFLLARTLADGTPDTTFGPGGVRTFDTGFAFGSVAGLALSGGRLIAAGDAGDIDGNGHGVVVGVRDDGTLDPAFGTAGRTAFGFGDPNDPLEQLVVRGDGEILTVGRAGDQVALARLTAAGVLDARFGARSTPPGTKLLDLPNRTKPTADTLALGDTDQVLVAGFSETPPVTVTLPPGQQGFVARVGSPNRAPVIGATNVPGTASPGTTVTLSASAGDPDPDDADPVLTWDFGDGGTATGGSVPHAWAAGDYTVTLRATDAFGASSTRTFAVHVPAPAPTPTPTPTVTTTPTATPDFHLKIDTPVGGRLLTGAPFTFHAEADPGVDLTWDYGQQASPGATAGNQSNPDRTFTESDLRAPGNDFVPTYNLLDNGIATGTADTTYYAPQIVSDNAVFGPQLLLETTPQALAGGLAVSKPSAPGGVDTGVLGTVPPVIPDGQTELKRTLLVRLRGTKNGQTQTVAAPITVQGDQPPLPIAQANEHHNGAGDFTTPIVYDGTTDFTSVSTDPDNQLTADDPGDRDRIIRQRWDFHDGTTVTRADPCQTATGANNAGCEELFPVEHDYFQTRLAQSGHVPLDQVNPASFSTGVTKEADGIAQYAAAMQAQGPKYSATTKTATLTVTDTVGRTTRRDFTFPMKPRVAPAAALLVCAAKSGPCPKEDAQQPQVLHDPIIAGGPKLHLDLSPTTVDPNGRLAYQVLQVGEPAADGDSLDRNDAGHPVQTFVLPGTQKTFDLQFPYASGAQPLSVLDTVYDETGASSRTRYDGFQVKATTGLCENEPGVKVGNLTLSGSCINRHSVAYTARGRITIDGFKLAPAPGHMIVLSTCPGAPSTLYSAKAGDDATCAALPAQDGALDITAGDTVIAGLGADKQRQLGVDEDETVSFPPNPGATYGGLPVSPIDLSFTTGKDNARLSHLHFLTQLPPQFGDTTAPSDLYARDTQQTIVITPYGTTARVHRRGPHAYLASDQQPPPAITPNAGTMLGGGSGIDVAGQQFRYDPATGNLVAHFSGAPVSLFSGADADLTVTIHDGRFRDVTGSVSAPVPLTPAIELTGFGFEITAPGNGDLVLQGTVHYADTLTGSSGALVHGDGHLKVTFGSAPDVEIDGHATVAELLPANITLGWNGEGVRFGLSAGADFGIAGFNLAMNGAIAATSQGVFYQVSGSGNAHFLFFSVGVEGIGSDRGAAACGHITPFPFVKVSAGFGVIWPTDVHVMGSSCGLSGYQSAHPPGARRALVLSNPTVLSAPTPSDTYLVPVRASAAATSIVVPFAADNATLASHYALFRPLPGQVPQIAVYGPDGTELARTTTTLGDVIHGNNTLIEQDALEGVDRILISNHDRTNALTAEQGGQEIDYTIKRLPDALPIGVPQWAYTFDPLDPKLFSTKLVRPATTAEIDAAAHGKAAVLGTVPGASDQSKKITTTVGAAQKFTTRAAHVSAAGAPAPAGSIANRQQVLGTGLQAEQNADASASPNGTGLTYQTAFVPGTSLLLGATVVPPSALTTYDLNTLLSFSYKAQFPPGETVSFYDVGQTQPGEDGRDMVDQYLGTAVADKKESIAGHFLFHPSIFLNLGPLLTTSHTVQAPTQQCIEAIVTDEHGLPRGNIEQLTCFHVTSPPAADPPIVGIEDGIHNPPRQTGHPAGPGDELGGAVGGLLRQAGGATTSVTVTVAQAPAPGYTFGTLQLSAGPMRQSIPLNSATIAGLTTKGFVSSRRAPLPARGGWTFRIPGVPAYAPVHVRVTGMQMPGVRGAVRHDTATVSLTHHRAMLGHRQRYRKAARALRRHRRRRH